MYLPSFLRSLLALLLGLTIFGIQISANPIDRSQKALPRDFNAPQHTKHLLKRADNIVTDFNSVTAASDKVPVGGTKSWALDPKTSKTYTTSEFYGCTVVIVVNGKGVLIGHYGEVSGACIVIEDEAKSKSVIKPALSGELAMNDFDEGNTQAWIIHSADTRDTAAGYKVIRDELVAFGVAAANIKPYQYQRSSGTGGFPGQAKGKAVVKWESKGNAQGRVAATVKVFIESDNARFTQDYDCNGDEV